MLYKYPVYSTKHKNLPFKLIGYDHIEDKVIVEINNTIKLYKQCYDKYTVYFTVNRVKYYLDSFRFKIA
jgi:hypothetical protein